MGKEEESIIIRSFKDHYENFPKGKIVISESPDFIVQDGPKNKTGIELVQLLPPPEHHYAMAGVLKPRYAYEQLMMTINLKEGKRRSYNDPNLNFIWLLIHFDYLHDGDSFNLNNQIEKWQFPHGFNKVFLFDLFTSRVYQFQR